MSTEQHILVIFGEEMGKNVTESLYLVERGNSVTRRQDDQQRCNGTNVGKAEEDCKRKVPVPSVRPSTSLT